MPPGERLTAALGVAGDDALPALIPYVTAGFPRRDDTVDVLRAAQDAGCAAAEIGIPFSDPLADGPTIAAAGQRALEGGMRFHDSIELAAQALTRGCAPVTASWSIRRLVPWSCGRIQASMRPSPAGARTAPARRAARSR